jgi:hypothetical protein
MVMLDDTITGLAEIIAAGPTHQDDSQTSMLIRLLLAELKAFAVQVACQPTHLAPEMPQRLWLKPIRQNAPAPTPIPDPRHHEAVDLVAVEVENRIVEI